MLISGNAPYLYPAETFFAILQFPDGTELSVPYEYPLKGEWGDLLTFEFSEPVSSAIPDSVDAVYLSIVEGRFYSVQGVLTNNLRTHYDVILDYNIVVGFAPLGTVVVWLWTPKKSIPYSVKQGHDIDVSITDFSPSSSEKTIQEICDKYIQSEQDVIFNLHQNGLPPRDLFNNYMKQFTYRYVIRYERWDDDDEKWQRYEEDEVQPEYDFIEEMLFDGSHDKLHDGGLLKYHEAGKPKRLALAWHIKKSEYTAYFWFEDERIREVFDRFYGAHPDTKTDFIIRIDPEKRKYELALYRYGLKEPYIIPEDAYQILVFKNKFEDYRSENYSQERGAWIW